MFLTAATSKHILIFFFFFYYFTRMLVHDELGNKYLVVFLFFFFFTIESVKHFSDYHVDQEEGGVWKNGDELRHFSWWQ